MNNSLTNLIKHMLYGSTLANLKITFNIIIRFIAVKTILAQRIEKSHSKSAIMDISAIIDIFDGVHS